MSKKIVIADDHAFTVSGMVNLLDGIAGLEVVGVASNGIEAIAQIKKHQPDCAVIDLHMPGANGLETLIESQRWSPKTHYAIVTGDNSPTLFQELMDHGVDGIFLKNAPPEETCLAIEQIAHGKKVVSKEIQKNALQKERLTARETEILHAISRGHSNNEIADILGISPKTVDSHRTSLMRKMDVHSTATLLVRAMRDGLIDVSNNT